MFRRILLALLCLCCITECVPASAGGYVRRLPVVASQWRPGPPWRRCYVVPHRLPSGQIVYRRICR